MPGRTPSEAFQAFIEPLQLAVSCIGPHKLVTSPGGRGELGKVHSWALNGSLGAVLRDGYHFEATMHYEIVAADAGGYRVSTRAYLYRLACGGLELFDMHWHPSGSSAFEGPHMHLNFQGIEDSKKEHLPGPRMTFEDAVEWAVKLSRQPAREDYETVLATTKAIHIEHRTWDTAPAR